MIAVDTNLIIYAHREDTDFHQRAVHLLKTLAEGRPGWGIPWPCVHEFLAITTHPRIFDPPSPTDLALRAIQTWIVSPTCQMLGEGPGYFKVLRKMIRQGKVAGPRVHDARIAALCLYNGVENLWTADRDFSRFPDLETTNPLVDST